MTAFWFHFIDFEIFWFLDFRLSMDRLICWKNAFMIGSHVSSGSIHSNWYSKIMFMKSLNCCASGNWFATSTRVLKTNAVNFSSIDSNSINKNILNKHGVQDVFTQPPDRCPDGCIYDPEFLQTPFSYRIFDVSPCLTLSIYRKKIQLQDKKVSKNLTNIFFRI